MSLNTVSSELQGGGYGDRVLAAVFAFEENGRPVYFIYNFKRGGFYPFVPDRASKAARLERELRLKAQLGRRAALEEDMTRWFPLWESRSSERRRGSPSGAGPPGRAQAL